MCTVYIYIWQFSMYYRRDSLHPQGIVPPTQAVPTYSVLRPEPSLLAALQALCALSLQEDLQLALKEGNSILESLREPLAESTSHSVNQDQLDNQATVQR